MVFPGFSKKGVSPAAKPANPSAPAKGKDLSSKIDLIEAEMATRDFDSAARQPASQPASSASSKPMSGGLRPAMPAAPVVAAVNAASPATPPASAAPLSPKPEAVGVSSVMMMQLAASPFESAPVLEQAALQFANGQDMQARDALQAELKRGSMSPAAAREAWVLLFDLLENLGRGDEFESAALDYAVAFETSPPPYTDRSGVKDPMLETGGGQYFALTGALDASAAGQLAQLAKLSKSNKILRIEFGKINSVTAEGCTLLFDHLCDFKKSGHDLVFSSIEHLMKMLTRSIKPGRSADPQVFWLLLLELCQFQHMQAAFEKVALKYCVTYEVSPPSWVESARPATNAHHSGAISTQVPQDAFYIKGVLRGSSAALLAEIGAYAADKPKVVIDFFDVRRVDVEAAGGISNLVSAMFFQGKEVEIRSPSPLIATLFVSMGMAHEASFTQRGA